MKSRWLTLLLCCVCLTSWAEARVLIAAASNFEPAARVLAASYQRQHPDIELVISSAASGTHFHQIERGAPFNIFLSADQYYPQRLAATGHYAELSPYATGVLVLASRQAFDIDKALSDIAAGSARLAIANPRTAPYGQAAQHVLQHAGINTPYVQGQNVGQTLNFLAAGAVDYAFVALSQVINRSDIYWRHAPAVYPAIAQYGVLLTPEHTPAQQFWRYLISPDAQAIIASMGYAEANDG